MPVLSPERAKMALDSELATTIASGNMNTILVLTTIMLTLPVAALQAGAQNACSGVDRAISKQRAEVIEPFVAKQLHVKQVNILQSFRFGGWSILYIESGQADNAFVFYSASPMRSNYVTLWSGAARKNQETEIRAWTIKNAPGIPHALANCFAWHVTRDRDE